ncbi:MAG: DUF1893 domain-containing protein [Oscillospiraceae bacterium]|jgi:hypothetical protein|nr:DUF1893 domain-containing protein [Oscillospiraceae bacterium]
MFCPEPINLRLPGLDGHTCAVRTADGQLFWKDGRGVAPPLQWLRECPAGLRGAFVHDKIVGKAAALLWALAGIKTLHAEVMSQAAAGFLQGTSIAFSYGTLVPQIVRRDGKGMCPMEARALEIDSPADAQKIFEEWTVRNV